MSNDDDTISSFAGDMPEPVQRPEPEHAFDEPEDDGPIKLERLVLPSGGHVDFIDPLDWTGADTDRVRRAGGQHKNMGAASTAIQVTALQFLITGGELRFPKGRGEPMDAAMVRNRPALLSQIPGLDLAAMEKHIEPFLSKVLRPGKAE